MKIKETRIMFMESLRSLCIRRSWFTRASNEEYGKFLNMIWNKPDGYGRRNMTAKKLLEMALLVQRYSDPETCEEGLEGIVFDLCQICTSTFAIEESPT